MNADWPVGLSTGCFYRRPILECVHAIRDAGFSMIEVCSFPDHLDCHDRKLCEAAAVRLRELSIEPYSFHAPFAEAIDITSLDPLEWRRALEEILVALQAAAVLGARYFVLHPGPEKSELPRHERLDRMENAARALNAVATRARELGVGLVLENMLPHLFSGHVRDLLWLLGAMDSTEVGICLDTGHAQLSGDLRTVAHKLSGHLWMVHASDNRGAGDDHLPPGEGVVPWPSVVRQLAQYAFRGAFIMEIAGEGELGAILERARRARSYLRRLFSDAAPTPRG